MKLLLDIGNTSAKVAVADGGNIVHFERREEDWKSLFGRLTATFRIDACVVSNVGGEDSKLDDVLASASFPTIRLSWETPNPLTGRCAPTGLGADRWAADIGAMEMAWREDREGIERREGREGRESAILVVDAGTCITYDLIDARGNVVAGAISPGVQLRVKAMHEHTALLPLIDIDKHVDLLGTDTDTSMRSGAVMGATFEIEGFVRRLKKESDGLKVFVTGGNHFCFSEDVCDCITADDMLVMRGLNVIALSM